MPILLPHDLNGNVYPVVRITGENTQKLDGTETAASSTVISATEESVVLLSAADNVHFLIGSSPTATANDMLLPGGMIWLRLFAGEKISIYGGIAYVCPADQ
jgi:hypothetical protein